MQEASVIEVSIGGMTCTGCEQTIQNNVGKLEGIKSVKASFTTGIAMIEYFQGIVDTSEDQGGDKRIRLYGKKIHCPHKEEGEK